MMVGYFLEPRLVMVLVFSTVLTNTDTFAAKLMSGVIEKSMMSLERAIYLWPIACNLFCGSTNNFLLNLPTERNATMIPHLLRVFFNLMFLRNYIYFLCFSLFL